MANKNNRQGGVPPRGSVGDVVKQVPNGGLGRRAPTVPPSPPVRMPTPAQKTPTTGSQPSPGGDGGKRHRETHPPMKPLPPAPRTVGKRQD
jgi:hypothetical protein